MRLLAFLGVSMALGATSVSAYGQCKEDSATTGTVFSEGEFLCAGEYRFGLEDGFIRLLRLSRTNQDWDVVRKVGPGGGTLLKFQGDGNLVVYAGSDPLWSSKTHKMDATKLVLFNSGEVRITKVDDDSIVLWKLDGYEADWNCLASTLPSGGRLHEGEYICGGSYTVGFRDGTLRSEHFKGSWNEEFKAEQITTKFSKHVQLQEDGNLVIISHEGKPTWSMRSNGNPGAILEFYGNGAPHLKFGSTNTWTLRNVSTRFKGTRLSPGERLYAGEMLFQDNRYIGVDVTGDFAYWDKSSRNEKIWSANTGPRNPNTGGYDTFVEMKEDGNLVVYANSDRELWRSNYEAQSGASLHLDTQYRGLWIELDDGTRLFDFLKDKEFLPSPTCIPKPVSAVQRFEKNEMICDGFSSFGLDIDGRMTVTLLLYYIWDAGWRGSFMDLGGEFGHHAYFQGDGNYVVYDENERALWSTRNEVVVNKTATPTMDRQCYSRASCQTEYNLPVESTQGCRGSMLGPKDRLFADQFICAGNFMFGMDTNGILGLWIRGRKTKSIAPNEATQWAYSNLLHMQVDGNLVMKTSSGDPLWSTGTYQQNEGATLQIDESGLVGIYAVNGTLLKAIE